MFDVANLVKIEAEISSNESLYVLIRINGQMHPLDICSGKRILSYQISCWVLVPIFF